MKKKMIDVLALVLSSTNAWGRIQAAVHILENQDMTGDQKRAAARQMLVEWGIALIGYIANGLIELAVIKMRLK